MPVANPVNWFEIPTADLERAQSFYENVFGIQMERSDMGPLKIGEFGFVAHFEDSEGNRVALHSDT